MTGPKTNHPGPFASVEQIAAYYGSVTSAFRTLDKRVCEVWDSLNEEGQETAQRLLTNIEESPDFDPRQSDWVTELNELINDTEQAA